MTFSRPTSNNSITTKFSSVLVTLVLLVVVFPSTINAHFTLQSPVPSREKTVHPNSNVRFFPIGGGGEKRDRLDCLQYPRTSRVAQMQAGSSVTLGFEIGNGARHVGPCTAQLVDLSTGRTQDIGSEADCVNKRDAMTVKLPSQTCTNCVIKVKVTATHLGANNPEFYDSCMDVNISGGSNGGGGGSNPTPAPPTVPTPTLQPPANPGQPSRPIPTNAPSRPRRDLQEGDNGNGNKNSSGSCQVGQMKCGPGGTSILMCDPTSKFVEIRTAAGTKCVSSGNAIAINAA